MGVGLVPFYEPQVSQEAQYNGDGKGLVVEFAALNEIAVAADLRPLSDFAANEFEACADDTEPPELTYHPIREGLPVVEGLLRAIRSKASVAEKLTDAEYTLEELEELARSFRAAEAEGVRFCLVFM